MKRSAYTRAALSDAGRAFPLLAAGALAAGVLFSTGLTLSRRGANGEEQ